MKRAFGRFWGFSNGWLSWSYSLIDMALYPVLFLQYVRFFAPGLGIGVSQSTWNYSGWDNASTIGGEIEHASATYPRALARTLPLGNLEAHRDWGFAGDYVRAMWLMLQQPEPQDFVVATGVAHSVQQLVELAFGHVGLDWRKHVTVDPNLVRPAEVDHLLGNSTKARQRLGWQPEVPFEEMIRMMVDADLTRLRKEHGIAG